MTPIKWLSFVFSWFSLEMLQCGLTNVLSAELESRIKYEDLLLYAVVLPLNVLSMPLRYPFTSVLHYSALPCLALPCLHITSVCQCSTNTTYQTVRSHETRVAAAPHESAYPRTALLRFLARSSTSHMKDTWIRIKKTLSNACQVTLT
jgi:hypothetical protein